MQQKQYTVNNASITCGEKNFCWVTINLEAVILDYVESKTTLGTKKGMEYQQKLLFY